MPSRDFIEGKIHALMEADRFENIPKEDGTSRNKALECIYQYIVALRNTIEILEERTIYVQAEVPLDEI